MTDLFDLTCPKCSRFLRRGRCSWCDGAAEREREAAIATAEKGASEHWLEEATCAVRLAASRAEEITTDDVWRLLPSPPPEPRALGCAMRRAAARGYIEKTSRTRASKRAECHGRDVRVWRSKV